MDDIPSISSGSVGSRFVSQGELDTAKARRDEQWKAAYARLGQEPPPQPAADAYDGRSLAEKLAANKAAKQDEWEERNRLANQFRALEEDEVLFLDSIRERQLEEEKKREEHDSEEVKSFKEAVAARETATAKPPIAAVPAAAAASTPSALAVKPSAPTAPKVATTTKPAKKNVLKGVVVKKKKAAPAPTKPKAGDAPAKEVEKKEKAADDVDEQPATKRRKVDKE